MNANFLATAGRYASSLSVRGGSWTMYLGSPSFSPMTIFERPILLSS